MQHIIDCAASDPDLLRRLTEDPLGVARSEGYEVIIADVLDLLGLGEDNADELSAHLRQRLSCLASGKWM